MPYVPPALACAPSYDLLCLVHVKDSIADVDTIVLLDSMLKSRTDASVFKLYCLCAESCIKVSNHLIENESAQQ